MKHNPKPYWPVAILFVFILVNLCCKTHIGPNDNNLDKLSLYLDKKESIKLKKYEEKSLKAGIISTKHKNWVNVLVKNSPKNSFNGKIRLKGDWADHIKNGKTSYRIKLDNDFWKRAKTFSLQHPKTRDYLNEYVFHKMLESEDILTPRYDFVQLSINGQRKGIYAFEEHFEKQLIEYKHRREGPIIKFNEDVLWKIRRKGKHNPKDFPILAASIIEPFKIKKTLKSKTLKNQFIVAQNLLHSFLFGKYTCSEVFDTDKMAKFMAIIDLNKGHHALIWHNLRFYYNPIIQKLEPIGFDGYSEDGPYNWINAPFTGYHKIFNQNYENLNDALIKSFFADSLFNKKYFSYLKSYSDSSYLNTFFEKNLENLKKLNSDLQKEFKDYAYDFDFLKNNAKEIKGALEKISAKRDSLNYKKPGGSMAYIGLDSTIHYPNYFIQAYKSDSNELCIRSYLNTDIEISGLSKSKKNKKRKTSFIVSAKQENYPAQIVNTKAKLKDEMYLILKDPNNKELYTSIKYWEAPNFEIERLKLLENNELTASKNVVINKNQIIFKEGWTQFSKDIIIPKGFKVIFLAGHTLNLVDSANFISLSPVFMQGSKSKPIKVISTKKNAQAFSVLLEDEHCEIKHVLFQNLGTLNKNKWNLTGAVNFYGTNLKMENCKIEKNHCEDALNTIRSKIELNNLIINETYSDAYDSDFCTGTLNNIKVSYSGNDALDFSGSNVYISNCNLENIGDKGISCGEESTIKAEKINIEKAITGIAAKDLSQVELSNILMLSCKTGLSAYIKKKEYGPARITVEKIKFKDVNTLVDKEAGSTINISEKSPF